MNVFRANRLVLDIQVMGSSLGKTVSPTFSNPPVLYVELRSYEPPPPSTLASFLMLPLFRTCLGSRVSEAS